MEPIQIGRRQQAVNSILIKNGKELPAGGTGEIHLRNGVSDISGTTRKQKAFTANSFRQTEQGLRAGEFSVCSCGRE